ncbi:LysE family translocator [Microvirga sp. 2TAF3]|uniref:LysE family translocator n=1 Tax=Microvirga sp. 2TAF3 TaxID=3233014 RepID=UPI003F99F77B
MLGIAGVLFGIFLAQVSPGPNLMAVSSASLGSGRLVGFSTAAGVATGVFIWAVLFALGIGAFLKAFPQTIMAMRLLGGGYLVYLGLKALHAAIASSSDRPVAGRAEMRAGAAYRRGLFVVMTNPKAALMWVAVSMYLASAGLSTLQFLAIGVGASISATVVYGTYALIFSTGTVTRVYARFCRVIEGCFGVAFGGIGAKLFIDGIRELKA